MKNTMNEFAKRLKFIRKQLGITRKELGKITGIDPSLISRYERGERTPTIDNLSIIAKALNISADYLLGLTDNPTPCTRKLPEHIKKQLEEYEKLKKKHSKLLQLLEEGLKNYK